MVSITQIVTFIVGGAIGMIVMYFIMRNNPKLINALDEIRDKLDKILPK